MEVFREHGRVVDAAATEDQVLGEVDLRLLGEPRIGVELGGE